MLVIPLQVMKQNVDNAKRDIPQTMVPGIGISAFGG